MQNKIRFYKHFSKRILTLAIVTGIIISISMPLSYLVLSLKEEQREAKRNSQQLAWELNDSVRDNPVLWQYNAQKFIQIFGHYRAENISTIKIYSKDQQLMYEKVFTPESIIDVTGRTEIIYNNQILGYVIVAQNTQTIVYLTFILLIGFTLLGLILGTVLYKYPTGIVRGAEEKITDVFEKLKHLSHHDHLTSLPNRLLLNDILSKSLIQAEESKHLTAVLFMDLDRFKLVNDTLGHASGDTLLQMVAQRLANFIGKGDTIARLGGDEFVIILPQLPKVKQASNVAQTIIDAMTQPFVLGGYEFFITSSIGISIYPSDGLNSDTLLKNADTAMFLAKEQGKNKYQFYNPAMSISGLERLTLESDLRKAIKRLELKVFYQPIIDLKSEKVTCVEALVRWQHPKLGLLSPDKFIPIAEETGLIVPIGEFVLYNACTQVKTWQLSGFPQLAVSVNLSNRQFQHPNLVTAISQILNETGFSPLNLQLEITESLSMYNENKVKEKLNALRALGIRMAIDDFGTGYSSLTTLKKINVDTLKIDKNFINKLTTDPFDLAITSAIISMAHNLKLNVVAEGVETAEQLTYLHKWGCKEMQGYLFCRPLPADALFNFLSQWKGFSNHNPKIIDNVAATSDLS